MSIDSNTLVFFDASCLVAAAGSLAGGSGFLLGVCARGFLRAAVSAPVLSEAERNLVRQRVSSAVDNYHMQLAATPLAIVPILRERPRDFYAGIVGEKDEHVLAAALQGGADFLLTLDKRLQRRVSESDVPIEALSPGEFIRERLPQHPDFTTIR